jgi:parallel beta-helix repeat protein
MAETDFINQVTTIEASWLNNVDEMVNGALGGTPTVPAVLAALGISGAVGLTLPLGTALGGTGATSAAAGLAALGGTTLAAAETAINPAPAATASETAAGVVPVNFVYPPGAIERYYTGSGDALSAIQAALNSNARVFSFYGLQQAFPVSDYLLVPAGVTFENASLLSTVAVTQYSGWGADHQGQLVLLNGNQAKARNLRINCAGLATGGIGLRNFIGNEATDNEIYNGLSQGILVLCSLSTGANGALNWRVTDNTIYHMNHGVQHWRARGGVVNSNVVRVIAGGGIWGAGSVNVTATGNKITDCGDVGLDMEGGQGCTYTGNTVESCNNGELSWFPDGTGSGLAPTNCKISANNAWHTATYLSWNGTAETATAASAAGAAMWFAGAITGQRGIVFSDNTCRADIGSALLVDDLYGGTPPSYSGGVAPYDCGFVIDGNEFYSSATLHTVQRAWNIVVKNNVFHGLVGAEANSNQFKNCSNGVWDNNLYTYEATPTAAWALLYYTDANAAAMPTSPQITNNRFVNTGDFAFKHQPFTSGVGAILFGNLFTTGGQGLTNCYTTNGGCTVTGDGFPISRGQTVYVDFTGTTTAVLNLTSLLLLGNSQTNTKIILACSAGGTRGANYEASYASNGPTVVSREAGGAGGGSGSGNPTSTTIYASFSGSTITVTGPASSAVVANMALEVMTNF